MAKAYSTTVSKFKEFPVARTYSTPVRSAQAEASRQAILDAAFRLFARQGYGATTLTSIANEAGVAVETVYKHFQSKPGLLQRLLAREVTGEDSFSDQTGLTVAQLEEISGDCDPVDRLRRICALARQVYERTAALQAIFIEAAGASAELRQQWRDNRARRVEDVRTLLQSLADGGTLAVPLEHAVDITWAVGGPEVFTLLTQERGWGSDRYEEWLFHTLHMQLVGTAPPRPERAPR
jgi:AcrR family transcriptional regulator